MLPPPSHSPDYRTSQRLHYFCLRKLPLYRSKGWRAHGQNLSVKLSDTGESKNADHRLLQACSLRNDNSINIYFTILITFIRDHTYCFHPTFFQQPSYHPLFHSGFSVECKENNIMQVVMALFPYLLIKNLNSLITDMYISWNDQYSSLQYLDAHFSEIFSIKVSRAWLLICFKIYSNVERVGVENLGKVWTVNTAFRVLRLLNKWYTGMIYLFESHVTDKIQMMREV